MELDKALEIAVKAHAGQKDGAGEPMRDKLGPLMFQFGYINKKMMPSQAEFLDKLGAFAGQLPKGHCWCVETRNPNHLNADHFAFLQEHALTRVWLQGYYMPPFFQRRKGRFGASGLPEVHPAPTPVLLPPRCS